MKGKKIFISGGAGVIGRELVTKLQSAGARVFVGDLKPRPEDFSSDVHYRQGDLNSITKAEIELFQPEIFIHLAATFERTTETYEFWKENFWHNVRLSNYLMSILKESTSLKRVIFPSSYLIYSPEQYSFDTPQNKAVRLVETDRISPRNLTGSAKLNHEVELDFLKTFRGEQFSSVSLRIFRGYGRGSRCVISRWVRALLNGETIKVYKKEGLFDYIFAGDVANGILKVMEHHELTGIVNLGNDNARRVEEVVSVLRKHFPDMEAEESDLDIPYEASQANMDLFKEKTGWMPQMQIEDTIPLMIEYEKQRAGKAAVDPTNVLISSASAKIPLIEAVKKGIQKIDPNGKVIAGDLDPQCLASHFTDGCLAMPRIDQLTASEIVTFCKDHQITAIIPTRDGELEYFAGIQQDLAKESIGVMVSTKGTIVNCIDKLRFYQHSNKYDLPAIPTFLTVKETNSERVVVKERFGAGSKSIGINLTIEEARNHAKTLSEPVYQPYIDGKEISIDMYISNKGMVKGTVMRTRDQVVNGESRITTSFYNNKLAELCERFVKAFSFYGHIILQVIQDSSDRFQIIECNARFGGASTLSLFAGLDSFYWFLLESAGEDITDYPFTYNQDKVIKQVRYPKDEYFVAP